MWDIKVCLWGLWCVIWGKDGKGKRKLKMKIENGNWNWELRLKIENENWEWNSRLKIENGKWKTKMENENGMSGLKSVMGVGIVTCLGYIKRSPHLWVDGGFF